MNGLKNTDIGLVGDKELILKLVLFKGYSSEIEI